LTNKDGLIYFPKNITVIMKTKFVSIFFLTVFIIFILPFLVLAHLFQVGEKLTYNLKLIGLPVGTQILQIKEVLHKDEDHLYLLTSEVTGSDLLSMVYHLEDRIESYVRVNTLYPQLVRMDLKEGSLEKKLEIKIDWEKERKAVIWDKNQNKKWTHTLSAPPLDLLSLIYWIRAQDLHVGRDFEVLLVDSTANFKKIRFIVSSVEKVYTYRGVYPAFVVEETEISNGVKVWFSLDKVHVPLQIQVTTPLGFLVAILKEVD